jgi:hypothetical protein
VTGSNRLLLTASATDLADLVAAKPSTLAMWRQRHHHSGFPEPLTSEGGQTTYDVDSFVRWARRGDTPAVLRQHPGWWWTRTVVAARDAIGDPPRPGGALPADLVAARRSLAAIVLLRAALFGSVPSVRRSWKRWFEIVGSDDPTSALETVARQLEADHAALAGLLVEPLGQPGLSPELVVDLLRRLDRVSDEGLSPGEQIEIVLDGRQWGDPELPAATSGPLAELVAEGLASALGHREPTTARTIYDPCAGEGALLVACAERLATASQPMRVVAQELDPAASRIARSRLLVHGLDFDFGRPDRSTLGEDQFPALRADAVVADPPVTPRSPLVDWLDHVLGHLADEGRALVVLPAHALIDYKPARRKLEDQLVDRVRELAATGRITAVTLLAGRLRRDVTGPLTIWDLRAAEPGVAEPVRLRWAIDAPVGRTTTSRRTTRQWHEARIDGAELLAAIDERVNGEPRSTTVTTSLLVDREPDLGPPPRGRDVPSRPTLTSAQRDAFNRLERDVRRLLERLPPDHGRDARDVADQFDRLRALLREAR